MIRAEIQGLRAVAVLLILAFHLSPERVPGGYIGVDVFFVVSGFLITGHLLREVEAHGRLALTAFWARRARRLLPASLLVLATVAITTYLVVPRGLWERYFSEIGASALYVQNWLLAADSVDYLAANNSPSPVQHFWSLSAEEQFYLLWPILIVIAMFLAKRSTAPARRPMIFVVLGIATVGSFITSVILTAQYPAYAYFITPTRAWEFGAGALLAFAPAAVRGSRLAIVAAWLGVAAIGVAAFAFNAETAFPGVAALVPTVGTAAVIWGGSVRAPWSVTSLSSWRPIQYVGDISYSVYLWHWPLIVLIPFVTLQPLSAAMKVAIAVGTLVLAAVTKIFVEDPVRRTNILTGRKPRWSLLGALTGMLVITGLCVSGVSAGVVLTNPSPPSAPLGAQCFAAAATESSNECPEVVPEDWAIAAAFARMDSEDPGGGAIDGRRCQSDPADGSDVYKCTIGGFVDPARTVALVGDSHARQYDAALAELSREYHWNVDVYVRSACAGTGDPSVYFGPRLWDAADCADWGEKVIQSVIADASIDTVFVNSYADAYVTGDNATPVGTQPFITMWERILAAGKQVVILSDTPRPAGNVPDCLELQRAIAPCSTPLVTALHPNVMKIAAEEMNTASVTFVDLTERFCIDDTCPAMIGGVVVYFDDSHLTKTYSASLAPFIAEPLGLALPSTSGSE